VHDRERNIPSFAARLFLLFPTPHLVTASDASQLVTRPDANDGADSKVGVNNGRAVCNRAAVMTIPTSYWNWRLASVHMDAERSAVCMCLHGQPGLLTQWVEGD
jgi:hypothetical protein